MRIPALRPLAPAILLAAVLAGCSSSNAPAGGGGFAFRSEGPERYARVDRTGQPAVATALLSRDPAIVPLGPAGTPLNPGSAFNAFANQRDAFNRGDPANDARDFAALLTAGPQSNSLRNIHYELGPALRALGLAPCSVETATPPAGAADVDISQCVAQVAPVVVPDVITYDLGAAPGWPNGRGFDDPVVDRLLAAALLRISGPGAPHTLFALVGAVNPPRDEAGTVLPPVFPHLRDRFL